MFRRDSPLFVAPASHATRLTRDRTRFKGSQAAQRKCLRAFRFLGRSVFLVVVRLGARATLAISDFVRHVGGFAGGARRARGQPPSRTSSARLFEPQLSRLRLHSDPPRRLAQRPPSAPWLGVAIGSWLTDPAAARRRSDVHRDSSSEFRRADVNQVALLLAQHLDLIGEDPHHAQHLPLVEEVDTMLFIKAELIFEVLLKLTDQPLRLHESIGVEVVGGHAEDSSDRRPRVDIEDQYAS